MKIHIVQKGDTLWKIAKKYGVDFEELKKMNAQLSNPDMIMPGMKIKVPSKGSTMKKEVPHKKEMPIKEAPKKEKPVETKKPMTVPKPPKPPKPPKIEKIEAPKQPYTIYQPVMPQPTQGIDINNYYMMNLSQKQAQIQQQVPQKEEKPIETPPKYEEESPPSPEMPMMPMPEPAPPAMPLQPMMPIQGGCPPLYPNYCYPVMPMHSICDPCYPYPMPGICRIIDANARR